MANYQPKHESRQRKDGKRRNSGLWIVILVLSLILIAVLIFCFVPEKERGSEYPSHAEMEGASGSNEDAGSESTEGMTHEETFDEEETLPAPVVMPDPIEIVQKADASYERWLAAAMVVGISLEYPDFELQGIYLASETSMSDHGASLGVYVRYISEGREILLHSVPLEAERTEAGTVDLKAADLGFSTFDVVDTGTDTSAFTEVNMDDLNELIGQLMLVSLYSH